MGENSAIAWTDHTFNPVWGCAKIDACCANCYAETLAHRYGFEWGEGAGRRKFGNKHWNEPLRWNAKAVKAGQPARVFCGSMCDVFEDRRDLDDERVRLWKLIEATPALTWLLLTKRPQNIRAILPTIQIGGEELPRFDNVWVGATVGHRGALPSIDLLREVPAVVRFISAEPLLEDLGLIDLTGIGWVIAGGESGPHARPCSVEWIRSIVRQCQAAHIPAFCKQLGARVHVRNDDSFNSEEEGAWPVELTAEDMEDLKWQHQGNLVRLKLRDRAGADPSEWAPDLRIRQFPTTKG